MDSLHIVGDVEQPMVFIGVGASCVDWLRAIDGYREFGAEVGFAGTFGIDEQTAEELLVSLMSRGLLISEAVAADRKDVVVLGRGPVAIQVVTLLVPGSEPRPVARPPGSGDWRTELEAVVDEVADDFVVLELARPIADAVEVEVASQLARAGVDHVAVGAGPHSARVGPLFDGSAACLACEDLYRQQVEPEWRRISSQLGYDVEKAPAPSVELSALAGAEAARQVVAFLGGGEPSANGCVLETGYRGGTWRHRPVTRNHQCECWWPR